MRGDATPVFSGRLYSYPTGEKLTGANCSNARGAAKRNSACKSEFSDYLTNDYGHTLVASSKVSVKGLFVTSLHVSPYDESGAKILGWSS